MKKLLLLLILNSSFLIVNCYSQQYGWVDISNNLSSSNGTVTLPDMHWKSDNEGWICSGFVGEIYHTTDGGQTFTTQTTQYSTYAIYMLNFQLGFAGGDQGIVYKTTNGGVDWITHGSIGGTLLDIDFPPNSDSGYCCGYNGKIYKVKSSGVSSMFTGVPTNFKSIIFPGSQGWVCGEDVIEHYNGSWLLDQSYPTETYNAIHMVNNTTGWAIGDNGVIIKTTDGLNWNSQSNPDTSNRTLNNLYFQNTNEGWAVGDNGVILHTTNGGTDWNIILDSWTNNMLLSVQFTSQTNGYILGNNKTLFKYGLLTDIEVQLIQPTEFKLEQNYPNPFNPSTKIKFTIPTPPSSSPLVKGRNEVGFVTLKVYDVLGNEVATLVNEEKPAGVYNVEFGSKSSVLSSGIYFYKLTAGDYVSTKKMILLK